MQADALVILVAVLLAVGLPLLAARTGVPADQVEEIADIRVSVYVSAALSLVFLSGAVFLFALWRGIPGASLGWRVGPAGEALAWAVGTTAGGLLLVWLLAVSGRRLGFEESPVSFALMPRTGPEMRGFLLLSAVAAVAEEYLFRGYLQAVFAAAFGSPWPAAAVASVSFGVAHGYQRWIGIVRATLLGALLVQPVVWTGSLFPAIVAHFWINAVIGAGAWRRLYPEAAAPAAPTTHEDG
ncbi:MAG: type II CAAX endopeptidase family protein [Gemmatimonadota bacterium]